MDSGLKLLFAVAFLMAVPAFSQCTLSSNGQSLVCADGIYQRGKDGTYYPQGRSTPFTNGGLHGLGVPSFLGGFGASTSLGSPVGPLVTAPGFNGPAFRPSFPASPVSAAGNTSYRGPATNAQNPGRGYELYDSAGKKKLSGCQHTLFERSGTTCFSLTASHCFASVLSSAALQMAESSCQEGLPKTNGDVVTLDFQMDSEATGKVPAKAHINKRYFSGATSDVAVVEWECKSAPRQPVVPLCTTPVRDGDRVSYGKIMGQAGLFSGVVKLRTDFTGPNGLPAFRTANAGTLDVQQFGPKTQNGDSGGPLIKQPENCLLAALSGEAFYHDGSMALYGIGTAGDQSTTAASFASKITGRGNSIDDLNSMLVSR
ncbi:MAG: trypsin-like serine protease [Bdellovibrionales bacterium]|nr:trypsin-like serine protease [Bdellovibrionales bacterium]